MEQIPSPFFRPFTVFFFTTIILLWAIIGAKAVTYTSAADGNWDDPNSWDANGIPAEPLPAGDVIDISHTLILTGALTIDGTLTWNAPASTIDINQSISGTGDVSITGDVVNISAAITLTGSGVLSVTSVKNISLTSATVSTENGNLTFNANSGSVAGNFAGINVSGATITNSGTGNISITGKGGNTGISQIGVYVRSGGIITASGSGTVTVQGTGGNSTNDANHGVYVFAGQISSGGGAINVTGTGGGNSASTSNCGVFVAFGAAKITSGGNGNVSVTGYGGNPNGSGNGNSGIVVNSTGQITSSGTGNLSITGTGGNNAGSGLGGNYGVSITSTGNSIASAGSGTVTVQGTGGNSSGNSNHGVTMSFTNTITSGGGAVNVTGTGGGRLGSGGNMGVNISSNSIITSGGNGNVSVTGYGGNPNGTGGTNYGVAFQINGQITSGGTGTVAVTGTGGNNGGNGTGASNYGVHMAGGNITSGSSGTVTVQGTGGNSSDNTNSGVVLDGTANTVQITSGGGGVSVTGTGGGRTASTSNNGISITTNNAKITSGGNGNVTVTGYGGNANGTGGTNYGVYLQATGQITSGGTGSVAVTGTGGNNGGSGTGATNYGVYLLTGGTITSGGSGTVTVQGTGANSSGNTNSGIVLDGTTTTVQITSGGGNVNVTGTAGGRTTSATNNGISITANNAKITSGSNGNVTVTGYGGNANGTGATNYGVYLQLTGQITSGGTGTVAVTGTGGNNGSSGTGAQNCGVFLASGSNITSGGSGTVTVQGTAGNSSGNSNFGVMIDGSTTLAQITSGGGDVNITGTGGGRIGALGNAGVFVYAAKITSGANGNVTVTGYGGNPNGSGGMNFGVYLQTAGQITSSGNGNVSITGTGGNNGSSGTGATNYGIHLIVGGNITSGGSGTVTLQGTGGTSSGATNYGVALSGSGGAVLVTSGGGAVSVTGTGGGRLGSGSNYGVSVATNNSKITSGGNGNVSITGYGGDANGTGSNNMGINLGTAGSITSGGSGAISVSGTGSTSGGTDNHGVCINGNSSSIITASGGGIINVTGIAGANSSGARDILIATGAVTATASFSEINFTCTSAGLSPSATVTDVSTGSSKTITFTTGSKLSIDIDGTTVNSQYHQLKIDGLINLNNAGLIFTGSTYTPVTGNTFTIVDNDGTDAITGTFNGLAEGATISNFLSSGLGATITYVGGTGNDAVLTVVPIVTAITWDGSSSTDWNTGANWSSNAVPSSTDNVVIPNVSNDPVISGNVTINNIDLQGGTSLTVAGGGSLTLNGTLTNAGAVTIQSGGSFLQGNSSNISGAGTFTVQRQGTASPTRFNYWSTPVTGGILPGSNGYRYNSAAGTNSNSDDSPADPGWVSHSGAMTTGLGYASMGGGLASFTGTPNNGTINVPVTYYGLSPTSTSPNSDFVHLGNPYPSGLTVNTFLTDNSSRLTGQVWAWDDDNSNGVNYTTSDYASRTTAGSISGGNGNSISAQIANCQGFVVKAISSGNVVFQNTQRNAAAGTFLKTEELTSRIWLSLSNDTLYNEINVVFMDGATTEFDHMLDGQKLRANPNIAFAVKPDGATSAEEELCIAALPPVTGETIVPLTTFVINEGVYTIRNKEVENMDNVEVYLEDRLTGNFISLNNNGEYSTLINAQNADDRFFLHFAPLATGITEHTAPAFVAYTTGDELTLLTNPSALSGTVERLTLTDMTGKIILSQRNVIQMGNVYKTNVPALAQGIYVVSLQTANNTYSTKISVR